jgi:uncharacterized protein (UPF0332 family)
MTTEQAMLVKNAVEDLQTAQGLTRTGSNGFAVARAYHAMLCVAEALLLGDGLRYTKHNEVILAFSKGWVRAGRIPAVYYRYLVEAGDSQQMGIHVTVPAATAEEAVRHAELFIAEAKNLLEAPAAA